MRGLNLNIHKIYVGEIFQINVKGQAGFKK